MVSIRELPESDLAEALTLHNRYTAQDRSLEEFRPKFQATPSLFLGAYDEMTLIGICLGWSTDPDVVELVGIGVARGLRGEGIGSRLLSHFEANAEEVGMQKVTLGSGGGPVDRFYLDHGYAPASILVRGTVETLPDDYRNVGFDIVEEQQEGEYLKLYLDVDEYDPAELQTVRDRFRDDDAIYIMEKQLREG